MTKEIAEAPPSRHCSRYLHFFAWVIVSLCLLCTAFFWSLNWMDNRDKQKAWSTIVEEEFVMSFGRRNFTPAELEAIAAQEVPLGEAVAPIAADADEQVSVYKSTTGSGYYALYTMILLAPVFLMGLFAIVLTFFKTLASTSPAAYRMAHRTRMLFNTPLPPEHFWKRWFNGVTITEAFLYLWIVAMELVWFVNYAARLHEEWDAGEVHAVHALPEGEFNKHQFNLRIAGIGFGVLFIIIGPLLFLPAARGSLVNTFLGVRYGTAIKWHRWIGCQALLFLIVHGILYHCLWASHSAKMYRDEAFRFEYKHFFSNGAGLVSWCGAVVIAVTSIPAVRRHYYWVFYRAHVIGAVVFASFGMVHWSGTMQTLLVGLAVYGIDVAYRWFQTRHWVRVTVEESNAGRIISLAIPLQEGVDYYDGCHVWVCVPQLGWMEYHPFSVASCSADPHWRHHLLVHSKIYNRWTEDLAALTLTRARDTTATLLAKVQGPFEGENMSIAEALIFTHIVVFAGGIGCTAVLPMLKRAALRRSQKKAGDTGLPPVVVIYTFRSECELVAIAPLLEHAAHIDLRIHYTGTAALTSGRLTPAHASLPSVPSNKDIERASSTDIDLYHTSDDLKLPAVVASRWLAVAVWTLTFFVAYWGVILVNFYKQRNPAMQLGVASDKTWQTAYRNTALLALVVAAAVCPLFPLAVISLWNCFKPRRMPKLQDDDGLGGSSDVQPTQLVLDVQGSSATIATTEPAARPLTIRAGRPDIADNLSALPAAYDGGSVLGVWTAGPKAFNLAVSHAAHKTGKRVDVHQMAFEL